MGVGFWDLANGDLHHTLLIFALQDVFCCAQDRRVVEDKQGVSRRDSRRGGGRVRKKPGETTVERQETGKKEERTKCSTVGEAECQWYGRLAKPVATMDNRKGRERRGSGKKRAFLESTRVSSWERRNRENWSIVQNQERGRSVRVRSDSNPAGVERLHLRLLGRDER